LSLFILRAVTGKSLTYISWDYSNLFSLSGFCLKTLIYEPVAITNNVPSSEISTTAAEEGCVNVCFLLYYEWLSTPLSKTKILRPFAVIIIRLSALISA